jgi:hypothetical protein
LGEGRGEDNHFNFAKKFTYHIYHFFLLSISLCSIVCLVLIPASPNPSQGGGFCFRPLGEGWGGAFKEKGARLATDDKKKEELITGSPFIS